MNGITESMLRHLVEASAEINIRIVGKDNALLIFIRIASGEKSLITTRRSVRVFASLDTAAAFLGEIGILNFAVDISHYRRGRLRSPRPDRAEALKRTNPNNLSG